MVYLYFKLNFLSMLFVGICKGENKIIIIKKDLFRYGINIFKIFFIF